MYMFYRYYMFLRNISRLSYLGVSFGSGQPINGVQLGPKAVRQSGLFENLDQYYNIKVFDYGDITQTSQKPNQRQTHIKNLHILDPSLKKLNEKVEQITSKINDKEQIFLSVGGDHSIATGTIHGLLKKYSDLKVIWVDAHGDLVDAGKSLYPGYHGMPLSHLIGVNDGKIPGFQWLTRRLNPKNIVHIGGRDMDFDQWQTIKKNGIKCFTPDHIDMLGIGEVMKQTLEYLNPSSPIHISFDIDAMQPQLAQSTGTKYRGGLTYRQGCHIIRRACHEARVVSMDLVQINPTIEDKVKRQKYRGEELYNDNINNTVGMGCHLVQSLFKKYLTL